ncbi:MAG: isopenicillin N synthase family oxygenase [Williamsia herbipolensis]|nr:isopenicillin N synthase family oxygenase [Williamsia herbipolensis]
MDDSRDVDFDVPVIDIGAVVRGDDPTRLDAVVAAVDDACRRVGFMQIRGHGIPDTVTHGLADAMDTLFGLPLEVKRTWRVAGANRGYSPPRSESLSLSLGVASASGMNDFFEAYNVGVEARSFPDPALSESDYGLNVWPEVEGFRSQVQTYFDEAARVARTLTAVFAAALGVSEEFFPSITDHSIDVLRMNNYAMPEGALTLDGELTGMGEHTDFGIVTVLWADQVPGLQVLGSDHRWHDVTPVEGALLVNLGDLTARLTGDRWMSTLHRVKPPIVDGTVRRRRSAAFFHDGNPDAVIGTLPGFDDAAAYEPITVRDHIAAKLAGSREGTSNVRAVREAERVRAAARPGD